MSQKTDGLLAGSRIDIALHLPLQVTVLSSRQSAVGHLELSMQENVMGCPVINMEAHNAISERTVYPDHSG